MIRRVVLLAIPVLGACAHKGQAKAERATGAAAPTAASAPAADAGAAAPTPADPLATYEAELAEHEAALRRRGIAFDRADRATKTEANRPPRTTDEAPKLPPETRKKDSGGPPRPGAPRSTDPTKPVTEAPAAAASCVDICTTADAICELRDRICALAEGHDDEPRYADSCERATSDCEIADEACSGCR